MSPPWGALVICCTVALPIENENTLKIPPKPITIGKYTVTQHGALLDKKFCTYEELERRERKIITRGLFLWLS